MKFARLLLAAFAPMLAATMACADTYPSKPIRIVVPYPPGGIADTVMRPVAEQLGRRLGQPVIIENRPGGKQIIGTLAVTKAEPDGYTLLLGSVTSLSLNPAGMTRLPYDAVKDLQPVTRLFHAPLMLVTNLPVTSVKELEALAKSAPGKYSYASIGPGSSTHLAAELFKMDAGLDIVHVAYKGSAPAITDLLGGQVQMMFDGGTSSLPHVASGKLRLLAVTTPERFPYLPNVPTMAESGLKGYDVTAWWGIVAPAGTPKPIVDRLASELKQITDDKALRDRLGASGVALEAGTPEQFATFIKGETNRWHTFLKKANIDLEN